MEGKKNDKGKLRYDLFPVKSLKETVKVLTHGAGKYAPDNWKYVPEWQDRYYSAAMRHIEAWREGSKEDEETGLHPLAHAICSLVFMMERDWNAYQGNKPLRVHNAGTIGGDIVRKTIQSLQRKVVYVAHPFQGKKENVESVEKYILNFVKKYPNYTFYSPLHATGFYYHEKSWEDGMKDCLEVLSRCDELWLCPGWENSRGCQTEVAWAQEHDMLIREV